MRILGIDLGTTNSLISVHHDGKVRCIPNPLGDDLTPSVVGLDDDGSILVGRSARERLVSHPDRTASVFKRHMGTDAIATLAGRPFRAEELSSFVLRSLKADAEIFLGEPVEKVVISVPAYFNETQRRATRHAAVLAGLDPVRLVNEPTAASIAYAVDRIQSEGTFLVMDLGGGTFDVTILDLFESTLEVRATAGDIQLGGEDFSRLLGETFLLENGIDPGDLDLQDRAVVRRLAEAAKVQLTISDTALLEARIRGRDIAWPISRAAFESLCQGLWSRLLGPVERALSDADLSPQDIGEVLLVGGATRMPRIGALARRMFGREPRAEIDPDRVVAVGAGVQAALIGTGKPYGDVLMTDVCPWSLGVEVSEMISETRRTSGHFLPIIERNRTVPVSVGQSLSAVAPRQKQVKVEIYQGESRMVANNTLLGNLSVPLPDLGPHVCADIEVRFTYTVDAILEVEVRQPDTGTIERLVVQKTPGLLSDQEIDRRLSELAHMKLAPRERAEYRDLLARLDAHYANSLKDRRERLSEIMAKFEAALDSQDESLFRPKARHVRRVLEQLDGNSPFNLDDLASEQE